MTGRALTIEDILKGLQGNSMPNPYSGGGTTGDQLAAQNGGDSNKGFYPMGLVADRNKAQAEVAKNMTPAKKRANPVRPGEAGIVGIGALLASLLGAKNNDINAAFQGFMGQRQQAADAGYENEVNAQQMGLAKAKLGADQAQQGIQDWMLQHNLQNEADDKARQVRMDQQAVDWHNQDSATNDTRYTQSRMGQRQNDLHTALPNEVPQIMQAYPDLGGMTTKPFALPVPSPHGAMGTVQANLPSGIALDATKAAQERKDMATAKVTAADKKAERTALVRMMEGSTEEGKAAIISQMYPSWDQETIDAVKQLGPKAQAALAQAQLAKVKADQATKLFEITKQNLISKYKLADARAADLADHTANWNEIQREKVAQGWRKIDDLRDHRGVTESQAQKNLTASVIKSGLNTYSTQINTLGAALSKLRADRVKMAEDDPQRIQQDLRIESVKGQIDTLRAKFGEMAQDADELTGSHTAAAPEDNPGSLRQQALDAIKAGADAKAVKARYKKKTGKDL